MFYDLYRDSLFIAKVNVFQFKDLLFFLYKYNLFFVLLIGFLLDLLIGDPYCLPHPIRWIGNLISFLEKKLYLNDPLLSVDQKNKKNFYHGMILTLEVVFCTMFVSMGVLILTRKINIIVYTIIKSVMCYYILATKSLKVESMKVYKALKENDIEKARFAVSMIVGRDTKELDEIGITKAAVETVAENTSDGVIAPIIYLAIGGPVLGFTYKAINTLDSMIGYKNEKYCTFGTFAAKLDDIVNYLPSRISAILMIVSCVFLGKNYDTKNAIFIFKRDRYKHKSPNSAQTESVCAGALNVQLAGDAKYFGKIVKKDYIGDPNRKIRIDDIKSANNMLYTTAFLCIGISLIIRFALGSI
ncbi:adenosylcobinamide-phosphate synthase CbiB [Lachnobacterium bovis]|uniref:adenosylcobinamide-phosphate synthase CbiB n=1 Tax=Lachnobacterium bovis TaxID=140626 RepID=UPI0003B4FB29|nr:adenosylcobinamide-phosphate synthase CbiB [Lachnobacterium bovis]